MCKYLWLKLENCKTRQSVIINTTDSTFCWVTLGRKILSLSTQNEREILRPTSVLPLISQSNKCPPTFVLFSQKSVFLGLFWCFLFRFFFFLLFPLLMATETSRVILKPSYLKQSSAYFLPSQGHAHRYKFFLFYKIQ